MESARDSSSDIPTPSGPDLLPVAGPRFSSRPRPSVAQLRVSPAKRPNFGGAGWRYGTQLRPADRALTGSVRGEKASVACKLSRAYKMT